VPCPALADRVGDTPLPASFACDYRNLRVSKTINDVTTSLLNDGTSCACENTGGVMTGILQGPGIDEPIARGGTYLVQDHLGSTVSLVDAFGNQVGSYRYAPFGA
jgi:hypothetical protein